MITGDDILIEYVSRLKKILTAVNEDLIQPLQVDRMEKFVTHYVWHLPDAAKPAADADLHGHASGNVMERRLTNRLSEMMDRRRRLIKYMFKKDNKLD